MQARGPLYVVGGLWSTAGRKWNYITFLEVAMFMFMYRLFHGYCSFLRFGRIRLSIQRCYTDGGVTACFAEDAPSSFG